MKHPGNNRALGALLFAAAVVSPALAHGQDAAAQSPESPWVKVCAEEGGKQTCNISQVLLAANGSVIASFSLQPMADNKIAVGAFVPLGFVIPAGIGLAVDGEKKGAAQFTICVPPSSDGPAGCAGSAEVGEDFLAAMRKGNSLAVVVFNQAGQALPIEMTLVGFSKVYDGEGLDPVTARAAQVAGSKKYQEEAQAAYQRMIERQQAERGTTQN